jgi:uncharacterized protein with NRDE domain
MCLIAFAHDVGDYELVCAANRDEFHARATAPAHAWDDAPGVYGGRDLVGGGTWLAVGLTPRRFSAVTNVRSWPPIAGPRSRGVLCAGFVRGNEPLDAYAREASNTRKEHGGFNLLLRDRGRMLSVSSELDDGPRVVSPGIHGLSNATLDVPWPKVVRATEALRAAIEGPPDSLVETLFAMLGDRTPTSDADLPNTGVPRQVERDLSPIFIAGDTYGTRCSTIVVWRRDGSVSHEERSFGPSGAPTGVVRVVLPA